MKIQAESQEINRAPRNVKYGYQNNNSVTGLFSLSVPSKRISEQEEISGEFYEIQP